MLHEDVMAISVEPVKMVIHHSVSALRVETQLANKGQYRAPPKNR